MAKTIVHLVYSLGGRGSVQRRAHLDGAVAIAAGHRVIYVTDRQVGPAPAGAETVAPRRSLCHRLPGLLRELGAMLSVHLALRRVLATGSVDTIVFHDSTLCWPALWSSRGPTIVYMVHALIRDRIEGGANPYGWTRTRLYRWANRTGLTKSTHIVCVSRYMAALAIAEGAAREAVAVVPNLLDLAEFSSEHTRLYDVIYAGRLSLEKGVDTLLSALADVDRRLKIAIVGDGPMRSALEARAIGLGLSECQFLGWVERSALRQLLAQAAVQVVPSLSEPQGVVALEGLAAGTPVIASNVGGLPEMVEVEKNGWLFPPGDARALGRILSRVLGDRSVLIDMRARARQSATAFDLSTMRNRLEHIYL